MNYKILFFLLLVITSCAKKPDYKEKYKEPELTVRSRDYDLKAFHLFVPSILTAPYDISEVIPFERGQALRVKLNFVEEGLEVITLDEQIPGERNQGRVMLIPGKYLDYKCEINSLGECINREEENEEISWRDKKYFLPDHKEIKIFGWNYADLGMSSNPCFKSDGSSVEKLKIQNGIITLIMARHYSADMDKCNFRELPVEKSGFSVRVSYQLIREEDIISKDFKAMPYPDDYQTIFGAFKLIEKKFDVIYKEIEKKYLMRINPNKKVVTYYLSPEFKEDRFNYLRELTEEAFTAFNKGLESAGTGMQLELKDLPEGIFAGDIRYNMINLLTDPSSSGILGFAPYTPNPQTGEFVNVMVDMFYGSMLRQTKIIYEAMRDKGEELKPVILPEVPAATNVGSRTTSSVKKKVKNKSSKKVSKTTSNKNLKIKEGRKPKSIDEKIIDYKSPKDKEKWASEFNSDLNSEFQNKIKIANTEYNAQVRKTKKLLEVCAYPSAEFIQGLRGKDYISPFRKCKDEKSKFCGNYKLEPWDTLKENEQKEVSELIISFTWRRILIHELGHNFGLRHNFKGNFDEENFYTLEEFKELLNDTNLDRVPKYSSIMDYGYTDLGSLPVLGKYDVAALRYIYTGKVETIVNVADKKVSKFIIASAELPKNAKKYMYCTDENVGLDPACNRHDEGKNYSDLADHYLEKYQFNKVYTNFRNERNRFDQLRSLEGYYSYRLKEFGMWRELYEQYERFSIDNYSGTPIPLVQRLDFKNKMEFNDETIRTNPCFEDYNKLLNLPPGTLKTPDSWKKISTKDLEKIKDLDCRKYVDLYLATHKMVDFFTKIILTPEKQCLIISKDYLDTNGNLKEMSEDEFNKNKQIDYLKDAHDNQKWSEAPQSCFEDKVKKYYEEEYDKNKKKFVVLGERGEYVRELREYRKGSHSETDIAAIGIWIDKLLAMEFLTKRKFWQIDSTEASSPLDIPEFGVEFLKVMKQLLMLNTMDLKFTKADKSELKLPWRIPLYSNEKNHPPIPRVYIWPIMENFELQPIESTGLNEKMVETFVRFGRTSEKAFKEISNDEMKEYQIILTKSGVPTNLTYLYNQTDKDGNIWSANNENPIARDLLEVIDILTRNWVATIKQVTGIMGTKDPVTDKDLVTDLPRFVSLVKQQKLNQNLFLFERKVGIKTPTHDLEDKNEYDKDFESIFNYSYAELDTFLNSKECDKNKYPEPNKEENYKKGCIRELVNLQNNDNKTRAELEKIEKDATDDFEFLEKMRTKVKDVIKGIVLQILNNFPQTQAQELVTLLGKDDWEEELGDWEKNLIDNYEKKLSKEQFEEFKKYFKDISVYRKEINLYGVDTLEEIAGYYTGNLYLKRDMDDDGKPIPDEEKTVILDFFKFPERGEKYREFYKNGPSNGGAEKYWDLIKSLPRY